MNLLTRKTLWETHLCKSYRIKSYFNNQLFEYLFLSQKLFFFLTKQKINITTQNSMTSYRMHYSNAKTFNYYYHRKSLANDVDILTVRTALQMMRKVFLMNIPIHVTKTIMTLHRQQLCRVIVTN